jgi:hypothetical protein
VIRGTGEGLRRCALGVKELLRPRDDFDHLPAIGEKQVAASQDFASREREPRLFTTGETRTQPALLPQFEGELEAVARPRGAR